MITPFLASICLLQVGGFAPITAQGTDLISGGKKITLRGVNLGGWFVEEIWMTPWLETNPLGATARPVHDHVSLWGTIESRLGQSAMERVRASWRDNWIDPYDLKTIKQAGFNHVRLPFLDSILDEKDGLKRLHQAVSEIESAGLYVVLDLHGLPGGQSKEHHTGEENRNQLWGNEANLKKSEEVWAKIGSEFADDPGVAGYDLMNEPMGATSATEVFDVYNRLYRAARKAAPWKLLIIEDGYKWFTKGQDLKQFNWQNVCYSLHFYNFDAKAPEDHVTAVKRDIVNAANLQMPMYVGEWNVEPKGGATVIKPYVENLDAAGFSWCFWCWKVSPKSSLGDWGVVRPKGKGIALDPFNDSEATLMEKIEHLKTERMEVPAPLLDAFKRSNLAG